MPDRKDVFYVRKRKKKHPTRSRLYIDPVAVRAALYCNHMSMEHLQRVTGYSPELCETIYYGGKVSLAVVDQLAAFFKCPANDLLMPADRAAPERKVYPYGSREPSAEEALAILNGCDYDPYKNEPAPADGLPARCVRHPRRTYWAGGYSGPEILEMSKFL